MATQKKPTASNTENTPSTLPKIDVFAKAKGKTATIASTAARKETVWQISPTVTPDEPTSEQLNAAVDELHRLTSERKALATQEDVYKNILSGYAYDRYVESLAATGAHPPTPLKVANDKGKTVTYVVQDRGHLTKISDEHYQQLIDTIGQESTDLIIYHGGEFSFDAMIMAQNSLVPNEDNPDEYLTVQDIVAGAIGEALATLVEQGKLKPEQVENLLTYTAERRFKPNFFDRVIEICGRNANRISNFISVVGKGLTRYVKC